MGKDSSRRGYQSYDCYLGYMDRQSDYTLYNLDNDIKKLIAHCDDDVNPVERCGGGAVG